jgi:hypothetical protein
MRKSIFGKLVVLLVFVIALSSTIIIGYSYFDKLFYNQDENVGIGEWDNNLGIAINTVQEFYDFVTKTDSSSTDNYYLANDLDFSNFNWTYNSTISNVVFRGVLNGNGKTINNLTININSSSFSEVGLFPSINGGTIKNITFNNFETDYDTTSLIFSNSKAGLIAGSVTGGTNTLENITIVDSGIRGSSSYGTGGLIGQVNGYSSVVNISNIKTTNHRIFSTTSSVGGLIGYVYSNSSTINIEDVDLDGELYSDSYSSYTGGIIGRARSGSSINIDRAMLNFTSQNTLETYSMYYQYYSYRYIGGVIGYNQTNSTINNVFFTGELVTETASRSSYIGTLIGRNTGSYTANNVYYSEVKFRNSNNSISYYPNSTIYGEMSSVVNYDSQPDNPWWDNFYQQFSENGLWEQTENGHITLKR